MKYLGFFRLFCLSSFIAFGGVGMNGPFENVEWTGYACGHCGGSVHPEVATDPLRCEGCLHLPDHGGEG